MVDKFLKGSDFRELGFTNATDMDNPVTILYQLVTDKTNLIFSSKVGETWWEIRSGLAYSNKIYCDVVIETRSTLEQMIRLYEGNIEREEKPKNYVSR